MYHSTVKLPDIIYRLLKKYLSKMFHPFIHINPIYEYTINLFQAPLSKFDNLAPGTFLSTNELSLCMKHRWPLSLNYRS